MLGEWAGRLWVRLAGVVTLLVGFLWSLLLPVEYDPEGRGMEGVLVLGIGWMGAAQGQFGWFANFGILTAMILLLVGRRVPLLAALLFVFPTALCAINALFWREVPNSNIGHGMVGISRFAAGYWMWLAVVAASVLAMLAMVRPSRPASR